jgi:hypothetical protein
MPYSYTKGETKENGNGIEIRFMAITIAFRLTSQISSATIHPIRRTHLQLNLVENLR